MEGDERLMNDGTHQLPELTIEQRKRLEQNLIQRGTMPSQGIPRRADAEPCALSFAQERLWFLDRLYPGMIAYNETNAYRLTGDLNVPALEQALNAVLARHEVLHTTYQESNGQTVQIVQPLTPHPLPLIDLSTIEANQRVGHLLEQMRREATRPFDLSRDLMQRALLYRLDPRDHVLLLVKHHISTDGWSARILHRDLLAFYKALVMNEPPALPELSIQYADYALWQRAWLRGEVRDRQLAYWREQLKNLDALELPTDHARPPMPSFAGDALTFQLSDSLHASLQALARREGLTLYMTLLTAFMTLLQRYTGQTDIAVGSPIAGRTRLETENLVGFFVNTLVMRADLSENPTFRELLGRVRRIALDAYDHQDIPFEKLVQDLQPTRSLNRNPFFQVFFQLMNDPVERQEVAGLVVERFELPRWVIKMDLQVNLYASRHALTGMFTYSTALFDRATIERMAGHFTTLLQGIVADPDTRISELPLLTHAERHQLLEEWSGTHTPFPDQTTVHRLFEERAEQQPYAPAATFQDQMLSYAQLNARANQVAHALRRLGVGRNVAVGIALERSLDVPISILAVLKAGGALVPLDPTYPPARLKFMMEDAAISLLLTQKALAPHLPAFSGQQVFVDTWEAFAQESEENLQGDTTASDLAYIIYTSGSTGKPKGALLLHRGLCNITTLQHETLGARPGDRVLQFTTLSFDIALWEIFVALCNGATLCLARQETLASPRALTALLRAESITTVILPPSFLSQLPVEELPALKTLLAGGEACPGELVARWGRTRRFVNAYGPTETTILATTCLCDPNVSYRVGPPIGKPLPNVETYVLDSHLQPVPIGVPGELYIGGVGVSPGYLNRPELTAERFIPHLFRNEPGARLYRSGDLVRYLPDGNIEFLGRLDHQVKIRGFRIELGEVETVIAQHPAVNQVVATAQSEANGDRRLVAYLVLKAGLSLSHGELRRFLQERLPEYMIPSLVAFMDELPVSPNGKIDRRALPRLSGADADGAGEYTAPRDALEERLVAIWQEVLGGDRIGIRNNFFELGGHSLLATQVLSRISRDLGVDLLLRAIFENPTIEQLAQVTRRARLEPNAGEDVDQILI